MDNFVTRIDRANMIAALIDSLTDEFGEAAASRVAARHQQALELMRQDPLYLAIANEVGKDRIALRQARVDAERKAASNGVKENERTLNARMWTSGGYQGALDIWISQFKPGERVKHIGWWALTTTHRTTTRAEIKLLDRTVSETDSRRWESKFISDADIHQAETAEHEREHPSGPMYGRNLDYPNGVRPR